MADLVPTTRLVSDPFDDRGNSRSPVERTKVLSVVAPDLVDTISTTETVRLNGQLADIITAAAAIPTDATFTVTLVNKDGVDEFTSGNIADTSNVDTNVVSSNVFLVGQYTIRFDWSTALSGNTLAFDVQFKIFTP